MKISKRELAIISHLRQNGRATLTCLSKKTGIPISTIFDRLRLYRAEGLIRPTALVDFARLGFATRVMFAIKVDSYRSQAGEYLAKHMNVNSVQRVNNGFTFMGDAVFRDINEAEDFLDYLEEHFKVRKKMIFQVLSEIKREAFLADPETLDCVLGGDA